MKKLFEVQIRFYVVAETEEAAVEIAARESVSLDGADLDVYGPVDSVLHQWLDAIPFGADDDKKCREYLKVPAP